MRKITDQVKEGDATLIIVLRRIGVEMPLCSDWIIF